MRNPLIRSLFLGLWLLILSSASLGQQLTSPALNYGFVSPNTRDDLKLKDAINGMHALDEFSLMKQARSLGCVVGSRVKTFQALGSWSDGAEYSLLLRVNTDESAIRYVLARLGRDARQKSVLYFHPDKNGQAIIYEIRPTRRWQLSAIVKILDEAGIAFRTMVPLRRTTLVYVVDLKGDLTDRVRAAAKRLRARMKSEAGNAEFIGDEEAAKAKEIFESEIGSYEAAHPNLPTPCKLH